MWSLGGRRAARGIVSGMRIIGGEHRGRRLRAPPGRLVRPTGDRAREALLAILLHGEPPLLGARFLDLFAGSGAVALEALSRGAASALLVESDPRVLDVARANIEALGLDDRARLLRADATRLGPAREPFDIAFLDPPYGSGLAVPALARLLHGWLAPGALVVVELARNETLAAPDGYRVEQERRYGAARFVFLRRA
jgi:16S rRNA (guanine966-N2)-methyltransferase